MFRIILPSSLHMLWSIQLYSFTIQITTFYNVHTHIQQHTFITDIKGEKKLLLRKGFFCVFFLSLFFFFSFGYPLTGLPRIPFILNQQNILLHSQQMHACMNAFFVCCWGGGMNTGYLRWKRRKKSKPPVWETPFL